jgi:hypothetical protein
MSKSKVKSIFILVLSMIMCFGILTGCGGQALSSDFDEAEVKAAAEDVIAFVNDNDSEGLKGMSNAVMKNALTDETLDSIYEAISEGGAFKEVEKMSVAGATENDEDFAVVVAKANYENKSFTYTITFAKDLKLAGLYYK